MAVENTLKVTYHNGTANVSIGGRTLHISRHDDDTRTDFCPVELVSAALGS